MEKVYKIIAGMGLLVFAYLILSHAKESTSIINSVASNSTLGIKTLQGRG